MQVDETYINNRKKKKLKKEKSNNINQNKTAILTIVNVKQNKLTNNFMTKTKDKLVIDK